MQIARYVLWICLATALVSSALGSNFDTSVLAVGDGLSLSYSNVFDDLQQRAREAGATVESAEKTEEATQSSQDISDLCYLFSHLDKMHLMDSTTKATYQLAMTGYFDYYVKQFRHRRNVFQWQLFSSKIIFFVVIFLVLSGIYFAWIQFKRVDTPSRVALQSEVSELEVSARGLRIRSPLIGLIILAISLIFFYLYLQFIFPINELF